MPDTPESRGRALFRLLARQIRDHTRNTPHILRLIRQGAALQSCKNSFNETAIYLAVDLRQPAILSAMLDNGASPNGHSCFGESPLHRAVMKGQLEVARLLVEAGAWLNSENLQNMTPAQVAETYIVDPSLRGQFAALFTQAAALRGNTPDELGLKALNELKRDKPDFRKIVSWLGQGANVNMGDTHGRTVLHWTVKKHLPPAVMSLFLAHGADPQACDMHGDSALSEAVWWNDAGLIRCLLDTGMENYKSHKCVTTTTYEFARRNPRRGVAFMLLDTEEYRRARRAGQAGMRALAGRMGVPLGPKTL